MRTRRFLMFLVVGGLGLALDAGLTLALIAAGWPPLAARPLAIGAAMAFTWLVNRRFTYSVRQSRSVREAVRYGAVAVMAACLNYALYAGMVAWHAHPAMAIALASIVVAGFSFFAYGRFAFGVSTHDEHKY